MKKKWQVAINKTRKRKKGVFAGTLIEKTTGCQRKGGATGKGGEISLKKGGVQYSDVIKKGEQMGHTSEPI